MHGSQGVKYTWGVHGTQGVNCSCGVHGALGVNCTWGVHGTGVLSHMANLAIVYLNTEM